MGDDNSALYDQLDKTIKTMTSACDIALDDKSPVTLAQGAQAKQRKPNVTGVTLECAQDADNLIFSLQLRGVNAAVCTRPIYNLVGMCDAVDTNRSRLKSTRGDESDRQLDFRIPKKDAGPFLEQLQFFNGHVEATLEQFKALVQTSVHIEQACNGTRLDPDGKPLCAKFDYAIERNSASPTKAAWQVKVKTGNDALAEVLRGFGLAISEGLNIEHTTSDGRTKFRDKWKAQKTLQPGEVLDFAEIKRATTSLRRQPALDGNKPDDGKPPTPVGGAGLARALLDHGARGCC